MQIKRASLCGLGQAAQSQGGLRRKEWQTISHYLQNPEKVCHAITDLTAHYYYTLHFTSIVVYVFPDQFLLVITSISLSQTITRSKIDRSEEQTIHNIQKYVRMSLKAKTFWSQFCHNHSKHIKEYIMI